MGASGAGGGSEPNVWPPSQCCWAASSARCCSPSCSWPSASTNPSAGGSGPGVVCAAPPGSGIHTSGFSTTSGTSGGALTASGGVWWGMDALRPRPGAPRCHRCPGGHRLASPPGHQLTLHQVVLSGELGSLLGGCTGRGSVQPSRSLEDRSRASAGGCVGQERAHLRAAALRHEQRPARPLTPGLS